MALLRLFMLRSTLGQTCRSSIPIRSNALRPFLRNAFSQSAQRPFASSPGKTVASKPVAPSTGGSAPVIPEHLLIYHAGTGRSTFIAFWKITTIFTCAFFCFIATPNYLRSSEDPSYLQAAGLASCGVIPFLYVAYTSAPFVTFIYLRLPYNARVSRQHLERWVRAGPPANTKLEILTMGLATRPRSALTTIGELKPVSERMGLVNYTRDVSRLNDVRKWHQYRPVSKFGVRGESHKSVKDSWVWDAIKPLLGKTQAQRGSTVASR